MTAHVARGITALLAMAVVAGCTGRPATPTGPGAASNLAGTWQGQVTESYGGTGQLWLVIEEVQFALGGRFDLTFPDGTRSRAGTVSGHTGFGSVPPTMQWSSPDAFDCGPGTIRSSFLTVRWERVGNHLRGSYSGFGCVGSIEGTFDTTRQ